MVMPVPGRACSVVIAGAWGDGSGKSLPRTAGPGCGDRHQAGVTQLSGKPRRSQEPFTPEMTR